MLCTSYGFDNPEGMSFCEECGTQLVQPCPRCGQASCPTAKFCGRYGMVLDAAGTLRAAKRRQTERAEGQAGRVQIWAAFGLIGS